VGSRGVRASGDGRSAGTQPFLTTFGHVTPYPGFSLPPREDGMGVIRQGKAQVGDQKIEEWRPGKGQEALVLDNGRIYHRLGHVRDNRCRHIDRHWCGTEVDRPG
jgi:hypothetical protein